MHLNETIVSGVLNRKPELRYTEGGTAFVGMTLAGTTFFAERAFPFFVWIEVGGQERATEALTRLDQGHLMTVSGPLGMNYGRLVLRGDRLHAGGPADQASLIDDTSGGVRLNGGLLHSVLQGVIETEPAPHELGLELLVRSEDRIITPEGISELPHRVPVLIRHAVAETLPPLTVGDAVIALGAPFRLRQEKRNLLLARELHLPAPSTPSPQEP